MNMCTGTTVKNNELSGGIIGIVLRESQNNSVRENRIRGAALAGIRLEWGNYANLVNDNKVTGCGDGISLTGGSTSNEVFENRIAGSEYYGIVTEWCGGNAIYENHVTGSGWFDLFDTSAPPPLDNAWTDNTYKTRNW